MYFGVLYSRAQNGVLVSNMEIIFPKIMYDYRLGYDFPSLTEIKTYR